MTKQRTPTEAAAYKREYRARKRDVPTVPVEPSRIPETKDRLGPVTGERHYFDGWVAGLAAEQRDFVCAGLTATAREYRR